MSLIFHCDFLSTIDFSLCTASLLILANADIRRLFIYYDPDTLCDAELFAEGPIQGSYSL